TKTRPRGIGPMLMKRSSASEWSSSKISRRSTSSVKSSEASSKEMPWFFCWQGSWRHPIRASPGQSTPMAQSVNGGDIHRNGEGAPSWSFAEWFPQLAHGGLEPGVRIELERFDVEVVDVGFEPGCTAATCPKLAVSVQQARDPFATPRRLDEEVVDDSTVLRDEDG